MKNYFDDWNLFEKCLVVMSTIVAVILNQMWGDSWLGLITFWTGIVCVVLVAKGKRLNYLFGVPNVLLYGWIAYSSTQKFHGEVMLNWLYFLPIQFYGWYAWTNNLRDKNNGEVKMKTMIPSIAISTVFLSMVAVFLYGLFLKDLPNQIQPWIDSASTVLSVIAMILMVMRYTEQWILWIIVDIVSVIMWASVLFTKPEAASMLLMWSAYLINACYGYWNWKRLAVKDIDWGGRENLFSRSWK